MNAGGHGPGGDCSEAVHQLYHYLDGELTDARRAQIHAHLESCPPCFEGFEFEFELRELIKRRCQDAAPASLKDRIARAIRHEQLHPSGADEPA